MKLLFCVPRADDLNKAKDERAQRQAAKRQQAAAVSIQRAWRGAVARYALRQQLRREWLLTHGPTVARPDAIVTPEELAGRAEAPWPKAPGPA
jgi:hypothetical protein